MRLRLACLVAVCAALGVQAQPRLSADGREYLRELARDTWQSIAYMADGPGDLPDDNTDRPGYTSCSNVGLYLACVAGAEALGLIPREEATRRLERVLGACERLETWEGFPASWFHPVTLKATPDSLYSPVDLGNYEAGLIVAGQAHPELALRVDRLVGAMNWKAFYCPENGWLQGGWDPRQGKWVDWYYCFLAADSRTASVLAIGHGVPAEHWARLKRGLDPGGGPARFEPGWMGGGLFMQLLTPLFLDEAGTPIGRSAANFVWAQRQRAKQEGLPAWGWSACLTPDGAGYIGYGQLRLEVVSPHATALAATYFPEKAVANLRELERLGAREPVVIGGEQRRWGFRDCVDLRTGQKPDKLLIWDQEMLLLACVNVLTEGRVREWFGHSPVVQAARQAISDYRVTEAQRAEFWRQVEDLRAGRTAELPGVGG